MTLPLLNSPSPQPRTKVPSGSNTRIGCAPRCSTRMLPPAPVATATTWPKFQTEGVPAAVVAGSGHSGTSV